MRIKHATGAAGSLVHEGEIFLPDEDTAVFDVPFDLAQKLLAFPFWEPAEAPQPYVAPEPTAEELEAKAAAEAAEAEAAAAAEAEAKAAAAAAEKKAAKAAPAA